MCAVDITKGNVILKKKKTMKNSSLLKDKRVNRKLNVQTFLNRVGTDIYNILS